VKTCNNIRGIFKEKQSAPVGSLGIDKELFMKMETGKPQID